MSEPEYRDEPPPPTPDAEVTLGPQVTGVSWDGLDHREDAVTVTRHSTTCAYLVKHTEPCDCPLGAKT